MRIEVERRGAPSPAARWVAALGGVVATAIVAWLLFACLGFPPGRSFHAFFVQPLLSVGGWSDLVLKAAPLAVIATGIALGMRAGIANIGAEGQLVMGAIAGTGVALGLDTWESPLLLPLSLIAAAAAGMAWAAIPALLRARLGVSEILTSLMLSYVAGLFLSLLVYGPWRDPEGLNFPQTRMLPDWAMLPVIVPHTRLHAGVLAAPLVALAGWFLVSRTLVGFRLTVSGLAPAAARYAGFGSEAGVWLTLLISGGLAGLAGMIEVAGPIGQLIPTLTPGYGFTAIIVAALAQLEPLAVIPAALLVALAYIGGDSAQVATGMPKSITGIVQGMLLVFTLGANTLARYRIRIATITEARGLQSPC